MRLLLVSLVFATSARAAAPSADDLVGAIRSLDPAQVRAVLAQDPSLAAAAPDGTPVLLRAAFAKAKGAPFVRPEDNPLVAAVLEHNPPLGIWEAAILGRTDRVQALIGEDPARVELQAPSTWRPLHFAAFSGSAETVRVLLRAGANFEAVADGASRTRPLHAALLSRRLATAQALLEAGADVHARQTRGFTALHEAALGGQPEIVDLLLEHGADPGAKTNDCESVADSARRAGHAALADKLASLETAKSR